MSDNTNAAPGGGEGASAPITVITPAADTGSNLSLTQAARALSAARHKPPEQEQPKGADTAAAAQSAEAPQQELPEQGSDTDPPQEAPGDDTTATADPAAEPPIEPPRSWTKEAKERWQSLPRETQEYLAQREQERDREVRQSQNKAAEERKAVEAERAQVKQAQQQYEAALPNLLQFLQDAQAGDYPDIKSMADLDRLSREDPLRLIQYQVHQQKIAAVQEELGRAQQRQWQESQSNWTNHVQRENELIAEKVPELKDKTKAAEITGKAVDVLHDLGFSDQELANYASGKERLSIYDHRIQLLIHDSIKFRDAQKAKTTVTARAPVPPVQRPGTARPPGAAAQETIQALSAKLEKSGSLKDAIALRAAQQKATRRA